MPLRCSRWWRVTAGGGSSPSTRCATTGSPPSGRRRTTGRWGPSSPLAAHPPRVRDELFETRRVHLLEAEHDERPAVVPAGREEGVGLALQQCLLLGLVPDVEDGDVGADHPRLPGPSLRVGPDETA